MRQPDERRRYERYSPPERAVALFRPYDEEIGEIKDIGKGGLAFEYLVLQLQKESILTEPDRKIDLFHPKDKCLLEEIPCKIVWEQELPFIHTKFSPHFTRRVGVHFEDLDRDIADRLNGFLTRCQ